MHRIAWAACSWVSFGCFFHGRVKSNNSVVDPCTVQENDFVELFAGTAHVSGSLRDAL